MLKFVVSALIGTAMLFGPLGAMAAELKIGVVDTNAILMGSAEGKRIQDAIKKKAEDLSRPLGTKRQDITRQMEEFQKQAGMMKEDAKKAKAQELEKKMAEFVDDDADRRLLARGEVAHDAREVAMPAKRNDVGKRVAHRRTRRCSVR